MRKRGNGRREVWGHQHVGGLLCSRYFGGAQIREGEKEGQRGVEESQREGKMRWLGEVVDGFLICKRVRVERSRQEENKTRAEEERARASQAEQAS